MKYKLFLITFVLPLILVGCKSDSNNIELMPCRSSYDGFWGFVNSNGELSCDNMFKTCPSVVRNGVFFLEENFTYTMYKYDGKSPRVLIDNIKFKGRPRNGILPICRVSSPIEVIDTDGKTLFLLKYLDGQLVYGCSAGYNECGLLVVETCTTDGRILYGVIDEKNNIVLKPKHGYVQVLAHNLFFVKDAKDAVFGCVVNEKGKKFNWGDDVLLCSATQDLENYGKCVKKYLCIKKSYHEDDRCRIYDSNGRLILECPRKVKDILQIEGDHFVYKAGYEEYGVMHIDGRLIMPERYEKIQIIGDKFLAKESGDATYKSFNLQGKCEAVVSNTYAFYVNEFGMLAYNGKGWNVLDGEFNILNSEFIADIKYPGISNIHSDYLDDNWESCPSRNTVEQLFYNIPDHAMDNCSKNMLITKLYNALQEAFEISDILSALGEDIYNVGEFFHYFVTGNGGPGDYSNFDLSHMTLLDESTVFAEVYFRNCYVDIFGEYDNRIAM